MSYLGGYQGDYLGAHRGDPGLFGFLGGVAKKIAGTVLDVHPMGGVVKKIGGAVIGRGRGRPQRTIVPPQLGGGGPTGMAGITPRGTAAQQKAAARAMKAATGQRTYRRMNVGNAKALRRAIRRQQGFVKLARRALRGTGYTITTRGSRRPRPTSIRESGPGSVVVR